MNESIVSKTIRLEASKIGVMLWRNNSGVATNPNGQPVRFGLGNDSKNLNEAMKSSDLIGIIYGGWFVAIEVKKPGWVWSGTPREIAQRNFHDFIRKNGGYAGFATCWSDVLITVLRRPS